MTESDGEELQQQIHDLEGEITLLRRRLQDAPKRVRTLEERLLETKGQLSQAVSQNEKLTFTLREAREHIAALRVEVDKLTQPPAAYGTLLGINEDKTVDVFSGGRKMRVAVHPELDTDELVRGTEVALNDRCCGESGTLAISRPDVSTQVRFRKQEEMQKGVDTIRARQPDGDIKILTSCPSCLQGLSRYRDDTGVEADYIVVEMAKHLLGPDWMAKYVAQANRGGIERVLL